MLPSLAIALLKNKAGGVSIHLLEPPNLEYKEVLLTFYAHKPTHYLEHLEKAILGQTKEKCVFYLAYLHPAPVKIHPWPISQQLIGAAMVVERNYIGCLMHFFVLEEHRGKGVGDRLGRHLLFECESRGLDGVVLGTEMGSPAWKLYKKLGFQDLIDHPGIMYFNPRFDLDLILHKNDVEEQFYLL